MTSTLRITNHQRALKLDTRLLRRVIRTVIVDFLEREDFEVGVFLVGETKMAEVNENFLRHAGATDVITFPYGDPQEQTLAGDIFVCVPVAVEQAKVYRATWQEEVIRYIIHGLLHLEGYDDLEPEARKRMKIEERRLLKKAGVRYRLAALGGHMAA